MSRERSGGGTPGDAGVPCGRRAGRRGPPAWAAAAAALLLLAPGAAAQQADAEEERTVSPDTVTAEVAGLRIGSWQVTDLERLSDASYSTIPVMDLFYQRELGPRTALHLGLSVWRRGRVSGAGTVGMWVGPLYGGLKYYPLGGEDSLLEPYVSLAAGPALGFEQRRSSGLGGLESGWTAAIGAGAEAGAGLELDPDGNVGFTVDAGYQWVRYLAGELDSPDTYRGASLSAGVTYRLNLR